MRSLGFQPTWMVSDRVLKAISLVAHEGRARRRPTVHRRDLQALHWSRLHLLLCQMNHPGEVLYPIFAASVDLDHC